MEISERFLLVDQLNGVTYRFADADELVEWVRSEYNFDPTEDVSASDDYMVASHSEVIGTSIVDYMSPVLVRLTVRDAWETRNFAGGYGSIAPGEDYYTGRFFCQDKANPHRNCVWYQMKVVTK